MSLVNEINHFYYRMSMYELQVMNENSPYLGLSYNSILYLNVIDMTEQCTVSKIAEILKVTKPAVTLKVNELVRQGAVVKEQSSEDKRVYYLKLSPSMEKTVSIYDEIFEKIESKMQEQYTEEQMRLFQEMLHSISGYEWGKLRHE